MHDTMAISNGSLSRSNEHHPAPERITFFFSFFTSRVLGLSPQADDVVAPVFVESIPGLRCGVGTRPSDSTETASKKLNKDVFMAS